MQPAGFDKSSQPLDFTTETRKHRQMGTASLLKSLGMRGLMKVTGFRHLTAEGCFWDGYGADLMGVNTGRIWLDDFVFRIHANDA